MLRKKPPDSYKGTTAILSVPRVQGADSVAEVLTFHLEAALGERQSLFTACLEGPGGLSDSELLCRINSSGFFFNDNSISARFEVRAYINRICLIFSSCGGGKAREKRLPQTFSCS